MGNWAKKKIFRLSKGFRGRLNNCFTLAIRSVHKAMLYRYKSRRLKRRAVRRQWISTLNPALREHGYMYSRFINGLNKSVVNLDRKVLADLAINEPFSFKAIVNEVADQTGIHPMTRNVLQAIPLEEAIQREYLKYGQVDEEIKKAPKLQVLGLRHPEREFDEEEDYLRVGKIEEDAEWAREREKLTFTDKEMKKIPPEVDDDNWEEDMSLYDKYKWNKY